MAASAKRNARIELTTSAAGMDPGLNDARRKMRTFQRETASQAKAAARAKEKADRDAEKARAKTAKGAAGLGHSVVTGLAAAAGFDLAGGLGGMVEDIFDTEKEMARFGIDAQLSQDKLAGFRAEMLQTSQATGVSRNSLVRAAHAYQILTGDADGAVKATRLFADVANASGASMEDIAAAAGSLHQNMGFDDTDMRKAFDVMLSMGHKGSVELRDFAGELSGLAPQFKNFGSGTRADKFAELAAAAQGIRKNFGSASEMATGFRAIMNQLSKSKVADAFAKHGVEIWRIDPKTKQHVKRDFFDIIADIKRKIPDQKVLQDILGGRQESSRALQALLEHWDEINQLKRESANSDQVSKDAQTYMASSSGKIAMAWEHAKNAIAEAITPERVDQFVIAITKAADAFRDIVDAASKTFGFVEHIGEKVRGALGGNDARTYDQGDLRTVSTGGFVLGAKDNDPATMAARVAAARKRMAGVDLANSTATNILDAEVGEKTTPESIRRAVLAKYSNVSDAQGGYYQRDIGEKYLRAAGISDDQASQMFREAFIAANKPMLDKLQKIADAIRGDKTTTVAVQGNAVVKAHSTAVAQLTRPGGRR